MKKIIFGITGFLSLFAFLALSVPAHAQTASTLTPQETAILKQSLDVLGIMVANLQAQAPTASPENRKKIAIALTSIETRLVQIQGTIAGPASQSAAVAEAAILKQGLDILGTMVNTLQAQVQNASAEDRGRIRVALASIEARLVQIQGTIAVLAPRPIALKQAPVAAPAPQANAEPFVTAGPQANFQNENAPVVSEAAPTVNEEGTQNLASAGSTLNPQNFWWPSLVIAALGLALFFYVQKRDATNATKIPETHQAILS